MPSHEPRRTMLPPAPLAARSYATVAELATTEPAAAELSELERLRAETTAAVAAAIRDNRPTVRARGRR